MKIIKMFRITAVAAMVRTACLENAQVSEGHITVLAPQNVFDKFTEVRLLPCRSPEKGLPCYSHLFLLK